MIDRTDETTANVRALLTLIEERQHFLVTSHARPDGDAIGSALGLMHLLDSLGKHVEVAFADPIPIIYRVLPGVERITAALPEQPPEAAILLECDCIGRSGYPRIPAGMTINIDHHVSGQHFADFNWIDPEACAVGSMVYDLAAASGAPVSEAIATCLYTAVLTDTGSFTYASTDASTFALAKHLVESGANANRIAQAVYFSNPPSKFHLLGAALRNLNVEGHLAWSWVTQDEIHRANAAVEDCEGVVNYLIGIAGVEAAVFLRELPARDAFRLSIRSKDAIDVANVAESFGGGGHRNASGCTIQGPLATVTASILERLRGELC